MADLFWRLDEQRALRAKINEAPAPSLAGTRLKARVMLLYEHDLETAIALGEAVPALAGQAATS